MADFNQAYEITMGHEGGIANHPSDKGGLTYKGITMRDHSDWGGWITVRNAMRTTGDTKQINRILAANEALQDEVKKFYKLYYWDVNKLDLFKRQDLANEVFDTGVNCGTKTAALMLQEALNLCNVVQKLYENIEVDGKVGKDTLGMVNAHPKPLQLYKMMNLLQGERYINIMRRNESQEVFATTWLSRVDAA
jgi:lysozyme family protein